MNYKVILLSIIISIFAFAKANSQTKKDLDHYEIQVDGLGCPFCAYGLEKKFKEFKGIKNIAIDIETGDFSFDYPALNPLSMDKVLNQVVKAGYTPNLASIKRWDGSIESNDTETSKSDLTSIVSKEVYVNGMCGMCKARIEKATSKIPGVDTAVWSVDTKMLNVAYDPSITSIQLIEQAATKVGHDTNGVKATYESYNNLPACCKYKRAE